MSHTLVFLAGFATGTIAGIAALVYYINARW